MRVVKILIDYLSAIYVFAMWISICCLNASLTTGLILVDLFFRKAFATDKNTEGVEPFYLILLTNYV